VAEFALPPRRIQASKIVAAVDSIMPGGADYFCDGVDDQVEINKALRNVSVGGSVFLRDGTFNISAPIKILNDNITLCGTGRPTKIFLANGSNCDMIQVGDGATALKNIIVERMALDGNRPNNTGYIANVKLWGGSGNEITKTTVRNCFISDSNQYGIYGTYVDESLVVNNYIKNSVWGILFEYSGGVNISNNAITGGIQMGIYISAAACLVIGNYIYEAGYHGLNIKNGGRHTVVGNKINNSSQLANNTYYDIQLYNTSENTVVGNVLLALLTNKVKYHICEYGTSDKNTILGNRCVGAVTSTMSLVGANTVSIGNIA